jgi:hypothetical protein
MGESKRRKQLLGNDYGKPPKLIYLDENHPDYQTALEVKQRVYEGYNNIKLVRLDFSDETYLVGAVHIHSKPNTLELLTSAAWTGTKKSDGNIWQLPKSIRKQICSDFLREVEDSDPKLIIVG